MGYCRPKTAVDRGSHAANPWPCTRNDDGPVDIAGTEAEAGAQGKVFRRARSLQATCPGAVGAVDQGGAS